MSRSAKVSAGVIAVIALALITFLTVDPTRASSESSDEASRFNVVLTDDAHRLTAAADGKVNLVAFLDFDCEACLALHPTMERIADEYAGRITFGVRYFPMPGRANSVLAAQVVESASRQGKFVEMYRRMYDARSEWGQSAFSQEAVFHSFAQDLGLDMARYEADLFGDSVRDRVRRDVDEGRRHGVRDAPALFLDNVELGRMPTYEDLRARIDSVLPE
ncbi:putative DsbA family dithiol-disulfide isomerase [Rhodococcus sp. 27YEA15]|uniref:DsbA family protein n=1 Tax=Rhodococcus sp. 27YEA15 TaxID=3156259 RepID=UPI003C7CC52E